MVIKSGKITVPASAPGVVPSYTITDVAITVDGKIVLTTAEKEEGDTRGQMDFYGEISAGQAVIKGEDEQLKEDTDLYYILDTDGTGSIGGSESDPVVGAVTGIVKADGAGAISAAAAGTDYLAPDATADGTYPVYNDGSTSGQLTSITITNGLITAVTTIP